MALYRWVTLRLRCQDADAPHLLLLCARGERPAYSRTAEQRDEVAALHGVPPSSGLAPDITRPLRKNAAVHHSKNCAMMSQMGQTRSFGDVGSMSASLIGHSGSSAFQ